MRDLCYILGVGLVGYGLWLGFPPLLYLFGGLVLVGWMVVTKQPPTGD